MGARLRSNDWTGGSRLHADAIMGIPPNRLRVNREGVQDEPQSIREFVSPDRHMFFGIYKDADKPQEVLFVCHPQRKREGELSGGIMHSEFGILVGLDCRVSREYAQETQQWLSTYSIDGTVQMVADDCTEDWRQRGRGTPGFVCQTDGKTNCKLREFKRK